MPFKCSVPMCNGNYKDGPKVSTFSFPTDEKLRNKWLNAIGRDNFTPTGYTKVCELHFHEEDIEKVRSHHDEATGTLFTTTLFRPRLSKDAVPETIYSQRKSNESSSLVSDTTCSLVAKLPERQKGIRSKCKQMKIPSQRPKRAVSVVFPSNRKKYLERCNTARKPMENHIQYIKSEGSGKPCQDFQVESMDKHFKVSHERIEVIYLQTTSPSLADVAFDRLYEKDVRPNLPLDWTSNSTSNESGRFIMFIECTVENMLPIMKRQILLKENLQLYYYYNSIPIQSSNFGLKNFISELSDLETVLLHFVSLNFCENNVSQKENSEIIVKKEIGDRHENCTIMVDSPDIICHFCKSLD